MTFCEVIKSVEARRFNKKAIGKKPDLELFYENEKLALCEVKAISEENDLPSPFGSYNLEKRPPVFNRIETKIHISSKQFANSNPEHSIPNIILFINYHQYDSETDLRLLLRGLGGGNNLRRLEDGSLSNIDLMIWINEKKQTVYPLHPNPRRYPNPPVTILLELFGEQEEQLSEYILAP